MAAGDPLAGLSELINLLTGGGAVSADAPWFWKNGRYTGGVATSPIAGRLNSLWQYVGTPSHGAVPGTSAEVPDHSTAGGLKQVNPAGGRKKRLLGCWGAGLAAGSFILYDRLRQISGLSGTVTTAQTANGTAITRYTDGKGNRIWIEIYTQIGATSQTVTAAYTDEGGNSSTSPATAIGNTGFREVDRLIEIPMASGDIGVQEVASVTLSASTGTAGNFGVLIVHPIGRLIPLPGVGIGYIADFVTGLPIIPEIMAGACLALAWLPNATTVPDLIGGLSMVEK